MIIQNKYRNVPTPVDGITFHSQKEAYRYKQLKLLQFAGKINELTLQPKFVLQEAFTSQDGSRINPITYRGDFMYFESDNPSQFIVEDVKGMSTDVYKLKKKLFLKKYPKIKFVEI